MALSGRLRGVRAPAGEPGRAPAGEPARAPGAAGGLRLWALTAAGAAAAAAVCAAAAVGTAPALLGAALVPGLVLVATSPGRRLLSPQVELRLLVWAGGVSALAVFLTGLARSPQDYGTVAAAALVAVLPLSLLWPSPASLRVSILLAAGSLLGAPPGVGVTSWPVLGVAAGAAAGLVALTRLPSRPGPGPIPGAPAGPAPRPAQAPARRLAREAGVLLAVAGVAGLLAAALLPAPPQRRSAPREGEQAEPAPAGGLRYLDPVEELDPGGPGSGSGNAVVFRVRAAEPALWRTTGFDVFDDPTWSRSDDRGFAPADGWMVLVPPEAGDSRRAFGRDPFEQRVTVEAAWLGLVPAAARLASVRLPASRQAEVADDGTVAPRPPLGRGASFTATSFLPRPGPPPPSRVGGPVPASLRSPYLDPPPATGRVAELARRLAADALTAYDLALAVERRISGSTSVRLGAPALPAGADPVDRLLFDDSRGSPEQAASAMAVLLRLAGVPARIAVGYLPGRPDPFGGEYVVRAGDAHAWVEAWFDGAGWLAFDPSGRFDPDSDGSLASRLARLLGALRWLVLAGVAAAAAWLAVRALRRWRARRARPWVTRCYARVTGAGRRLGRVRRPHETPSEYCRALAGEVGDGRVERVGELLTEAAFSPAGVPPDQQAWADEVVSSLVLTAHRRPARPDTGRGTPPT